MGNSFDCCSQRDKEDPEEPVRSPPHSPVLTRRKSITGAEFIIDQDGLIQDSYEFENILGKGAFGTVTKARHRSSGAVRAIKAILKRQLSKQDRVKLRREIEIMKAMDHPNIIKLYETFEDSRRLHLVMEMCTGGDLYNRLDDVARTGGFTEAQVAGIMKHMLHAVCFVHKVGVCHRDLKPENFLLASQECIEETHLKLTDFGISAFCDDESFLATKIGTAIYMAPEVLTGKYNKSVDIWSVGVILYVLLSGMPPFHGNTTKEILGKVKRGSYSYTAPSWMFVSADAKDLIDRLLVRHPQSRFTAMQALDHVWIEHKAPKAHSARLSTEVVNNLRSFRNKNRFMKAVLHLIAREMDEKEVDALRTLFLQMDTNGDGTLTTQEVREAMEKGGWKKIPADIQALLETIDADGDGVLAYTEFLAASLNRAQYAQEHQCRAAFRIFDKDGDGKITKQEIMGILRESEAGVDSQCLQDLFAEIDTGGDGAIDYDEFCQMINGASHTPLPTPKLHEREPAADIDPED